MDLESMGATATAVLTAFGLKVLGALAAWAHSVNVPDAARRLKEALVRIPNMQKSPPRGYTSNDHYWRRA